MEPDILATPGQSAARNSRWVTNGVPGKLGISPLQSVTAPPETVHGTVNGKVHAHVLRAPQVLNGHGEAASDWSLHAIPASGDLALQRAPVALRDADTFYLRLGKRALDILGAVSALIVTAPFMAIIAVLIKLESRGPILYKSHRVGRGGRVFTFYKLRSMVDGAHSRRDDVAHLNECDGPVFKISNDPRVTRIGRLLRRTSIDEIPQFLNVLKGEMSLVGPRPPIPEEVARYEPWQLKRLSVRPGITCLWQISGRSRIGFEEWMRLDLQYIRHQSLRMDLRILLRTIPAVISRDGAY